MSSSWLVLDERPTSRPGPASSPFEPTGSSTRPTANPGLAWWRDAQLRAVLPGREGHGDPRRPLDGPDRARDARRRERLQRAPARPPGDLALGPHRPDARTRAG